MTKDEKFVLSLYPTAYSWLGWHGDGLVYLINGVEEFEVLNFRTASHSESGSWKICADILNKMMLDKLES